MARANHNSRVPNKETQKHYEKPQHQEVIKEEDVQVICPGKSPAAELEKALNKLHLEAIPSGAKCLLVIDQFEEVETQCRDETEQKKFWQKLVSLLSEQQYRDKLHIIFTLRSDFESRLRNKFEKFEAELNKQTQKPETQKLNWGAARFIVQQMEPQELQEVIEGPAAVKGVYFTAEQRKGRTLVQQLVQEVAGMPGALPLLSFALQEIYRKLAERFVKADRQGNDPPKREIIWDDYDKLNGGVPQSITRRATEEYERLAKDNDGKKLDKAEAQARQTILKWVMLRMVVTSGEGLTRRRVLRSELEYPEPNNKYVNPVIDRFVEARLIVRGGETESEKYVEPSHDALIREWEMIKNWIDEIEKIGKSEKSETILSLQQRLRMNAAANDWDKNDRDTGFLWHNDPRLPQLKQVFNSPDSWLNQLETDFVKNSIEEKRKQEDELTQNRINELTPSANARFKDHEQLEALTHILKAGKLVQKLICEKSPYLSEETRRNTPLVLRQILSKVEEKNRFRLQSASAHTVDFSRDGQIVATVDWNSIVTLFDPEGKQINPGQMNGDMLTELSQTPEGKPLFSLGSRSGRLYKKDNGKLVLSDYYLSPDGRIIAHLNRNVKKGKVTLYSRDGAKLNTLTGLDEDTLMTVAFSPDGQIIAAGGWYGWLYLWQRDGTSIKKQSIGGGSINAIDFSPKVEMLATGSNDGKVRLWQPDGTESKLFQAHSDAIWGLCFSPKVEMFATASNDRTVKLWKSDGTEVKTLEGHKGIVRAVAFNPNNDSQNLASVSDDGSVKIWNLGGTGLKMLDRQENSVYTVRFSPDGQTILTTSGHGKVSFWTTDGILLKQYPHWHNGPISTLDFSPNGERIVTASGDKEVRLHNSDGNGRKEIKSYKDQIEVLGVSFSPDNQVIALADQQGSVKLYNLDDGTLTTLRDASGSPAWAVKFSPDGNILASAHSEGVVELRQLNGTLLNTLASGTYSGYPNLVLGIDFSPNGDLIASAHLDGTVRLWQLDGSSDQPLILGEPGSNVVKERIFIPVRFSPDGQTIASAHADGTVKLWKLDGSLYKLYKILEGHKSCVTAVDFSPNGKTLAFASEDRTVILWDLDGIMDLDGLLQCGCQWAEGYLTNNLNVTNEDRQIILNINENP